MRQLFNKIYLCSALASAFESRIYQLIKRVFSANMSFVGCVWKRGRYIVQRLAAILGDLTFSISFV